MGMGGSSISVISLNPPYSQSQPGPGFGVWFPSSSTILHPPSIFRFYIHTHHNRGRPRMPFRLSSSSSSFNNNNNKKKWDRDDDRDCPVPLDQQPINEYQSLKDSSWASGDAVEFYSRVFATGACVAVLLGVPLVGSGSQASPVTVGLTCVSTGLLASLLVVVRMYVGWTYVGNRLLGATVEYEETGWYDGQVWVKRPEVLARDRLLASFAVKPVVSRLKKSLVILGTSLLMCCAVVLVITFTHLDEDDDDIKTSSSSSGLVPRVYSEESARNFEPDVFCGLQSQPN